MNLRPVRRWLILVGLAAFFCPTPVAAEQRIRVATYNIQFLKASIPSQRATNIRHVIAELGADVIGLQEIDNRAALENVFPAAEWHLVIDDDSSDSQDVAVAVRKPLRVLARNGSPHDLNADDEDFLFSGSSHDSEFPSRRDALCVEVELPNNDGRFSVIVIHAKARVGGRATTDIRRENAARKLLGVLDSQFDDKSFIVLGDMNDNPDDRSLNILEAGSPDAAGGEEHIEGPFLLNLTEELLRDDHVSHGLGASDINGDALNTIRQGSRARNNDHRDDNTNTGAILFDQLLVPLRMKPNLVDGSAKVFDRKVARSGGNNAASDHVPVSADFIFGISDDPEPPPADGTVRIAAALPNPDGADEGKETVTLRNGTDANVSLAAWRLRDRAQKSFGLTGDVAAGAQVTFTLPAGKLQLNNDGDDLVLVDAQGNTVDRASYTKSQVNKGQSISFDE